MDTEIMDNMVPEKKPRPKWLTVFTVLDCVLAFPLIVSVIAEALTVYSALTLHEITDSEAGPLAAIGFLMVLFLAVMTETVAICAGILTGSASCAFLIVLLCKRGKVPENSRKRVRVLLWMNGIYLVLSLMIVFLIFIL